jgi:hypothetical protein
MTTDYREPETDELVIPDVLDFLDGPAAAHAPTTAPPGTPWSARLRQFVRPSVYYVMSRLVVLLAALGGKWMVPRLNPFQALTTGWDGYWYTLIAQHGYPSQVFNENHGSRWAFFPA